MGASFGVVVLVLVVLPPLPPSSTVCCCAPVASYSYTPVSPRQSGQTLLHLFCTPSAQGTVELEIVGSLLDLGADAALADMNGKTALHVAAEAAAVAQAAQQVVIGGAGPEAAVRQIVMSGVGCPTFADDADPAAQSLVQDLVGEYNRFRGDLWGHAEQGSVQAARELIAAVRFSIDFHRFTTVLRPFCHCFAMIWDHFDEQMEGAPVDVSIITKCYY